MRTKLGIGIGALVVVTLAVSGVAAAAATGPASAKTAATAVVPSSALTANTISEEQARQIAIEAMPGSRVVEIETDDRADRAVWKVTLSTANGRVIVLVDAVTGAVTFDQAAGNRDDDATEDAHGTDDPAGHDAVDDHRGGPGDDGPGHH
jgi:uncharacterized protein YpmB